MWRQQHVSRSMERAREMPPTRLERAAPCSRRLRPRYRCHHRHHCNLPQRWHLQWRRSRSLVVRRQGSTRERRFACPMGAAELAAQREPTRFRAASTLYFSQPRQFWPSEAKWRPLALPIRAGPDPAALCFALPTGPGEEASRSQAVDEEAKPRRLILLSVTTRTKLGPSTQAVVVPGARLRG